MTATTMIQYLDYFAKTDGSDSVSVGIVTDTGLRGVVTQSDALLTAHALASVPARDVWDETDLCALAGLQRKPNAPTVP